MRLEEYTNDGIGNSMGLRQFAPSGPNPCLRVLFKPSFHPEVCITLEAGQMHAVALTTMYWREPIPRPMSVISEIVAMNSAQFQAITNAHKTAFAEHDEELRSGAKFVWLDGMSIASILMTENAPLMFEGQPGGPQRMRFAAELLRMAFTSVTSIPLRNRIADCAAYCDLDLPKQIEPEQPPIVNILVLGKSQ